MFNICLYCAVLENKNGYNVFTLVPVHLCPPRDQPPKLGIFIRNTCTRYRWPIVEYRYLTFGYMGRWQRCTSQISGKDPSSRFRNGYRTVIGCLILHFSYNVTHFLLRSSYRNRNHDRYRFSRHVLLIFNVGHQRWYGMSVYSVANWRRQPEYLDRHWNRFTTVSDTVTNMYFVNQNASEFEITGERRAVAINGLSRSSSPQTPRREGTVDMRF
jgi:hypothetical protein